MTLAFFAFLVIFYLLPCGGGTLVDWLWRHAPDHLAALVVVRAGRMVFNGAFYAAVLAAWALSLSFGAAASGGRGRTPSFRLAAGLVGGAASALVLACLCLGRPVHGPLSLALVVFLTGLIPADRGRSRPAKSAPGTPNAGDPSSAPPGSGLAPVPLSADARPLSPTEPPPLNPDAVAQYVRAADAETPPSR